MAVIPRPVRALPSTPAHDTDAGARTALGTRIVIGATIVLGQLFAIVVALEASLLDHDAEAWLLAGFSIVSFVVMLVVTRVDPPPRSRRLLGQDSPGIGTYVSHPIAEDAPALPDRGDG